MFIDVADISIKAGKGGDGIVSWRREKYEPSGGPYGGDGGRGGSVILKTDEGIRTLMDFRYRKNYKAENGEDGRTKKQYGKDGKDLILKVPVGTLIKDAETDRVIADLREKGQTYVVAKGGIGGRGNAKFATPTRQAPGFAEPGKTGEERKIKLELKLLADVGLIGFPNVGKSTILSVISAAKPKIANYHFTTLKPNLGVVRVGEGKDFVIADIPGLIEGASEGVGLGHEFLRHIERTRVLVHVLDASGSEGRIPVEDFNIINEELFKYNEKLRNKPQIIIANKMDMPDSETGLKLIEESFGDMDMEIIPLSAITHQGIDKLKYSILNLLEQTEIEYDTFDQVYEYEEVEDKRIVVKYEDGKYKVEGPYIEELLYRTYFDDSDSLKYFQSALRKNGIIEKLKELGITEGESVFIMDNEFEFFE